MLQAIEGVYKNGIIDLTEVPTVILESRVIVTFLQTESTTKAMAIMQLGMFTGLNQSREEEFQIAEFVSDADDGMNWS